MALKPFSGTLDDAPPLKPFAGELDPPTQATPATPAIARPKGFIDASAAAGFKRSLPETKSLLYGAGAALAGAVGLDGVRDSALENYQRIQKEEVEPLQGQSTFKGSMSGDTSLVDWAGDTLGNFGGQALQSLAAAGAGAAIGGAAGTVAPGAGNLAGGVGGAVVGAIARPAVKKLVGKEIAEMVAKGATKDAVGKAALKRAGMIAAPTALNIAQETGIGFTGRAEDAAKAGEQLTQGDAARAIGWGVPAGLVDTAAEALTAARVLRGGTGEKLVKRVAAGAARGAATEGGTEGVQAVMERAGANRQLTGAEAYNDYLENVAAGALGGGVAGGGGSVRKARATDEALKKDGLDQNVGTSNQPTDISEPAVDPATPDPFDGAAMNAELDAAMGQPASKPAPAANPAQQAAAEMRMQAQVMDAQAQTGIGKAAAMATAMQADSIEQSNPFGYQPPTFGYEAPTFPPAPNDGRTRLAQQAQAQGIDPRIVLTLDDAEAGELDQYDDKLLATYAKGLWSDLQSGRRTLPGYNPQEDGRGPRQDAARPVQEQSGVDSVGLRGDAVPDASSGGDAAGAVAVQAGDGAASLAGQAAVPGEPAGAQAEGVIDALSAERRSRIGEDRTQPNTDLDNALNAILIGGVNEQALMDAVRYGVENGRPEIARAAAVELRKSANSAAKQKPGVPEGSPKYAAIAADLARRAQEAAKLADEAEAMATQPAGADEAAGAQAQGVTATAGQAPQAASSGQIEAPQSAPATSQPELPSSATVDAAPPTAPDSSPLPAEAAAQNQPKTTASEVSVPSPQGTPVEGGGQPIQEAIDSDPVLASNRDRAVRASTMDEAAFVAAEVADAATKAAQAGAEAKAANELRIDYDARLKTHVAATRKFRLKNASLRKNTPEALVAAESALREEGRNLRRREEMAAFDLQQAKGVTESSMRAMYGRLRERLAVKPQERVPKKPRSAMTNKELRAAEAARKENKEADKEQEAQKAPQKAEPFEHNGTRIYPTKIKSGDEVVTRFAVESADNKARREAGERTLGGDSLHATREAAIKAAEQESVRRAQRKAREQELAAEQAASDKAKAERKERNAGKSLAQIKADDYLDAPVSIGGKPTTRRARIEAKIAAGEKPSITMVNKIKPMSRMAFHRASNEEQAAHERKVRAGGKVAEYAVGDSIVSKTEYDYAVGLVAAQEAKPAEPQPTPSQQQPDSKYAKYDEAAKPDINPQQAARDANVPANLIAARDAADARSKAASAAMQAFPKGEMGLTPDAVKATPEWKAARIEMDRAMTALRNANAAVNVARKTAAAKAKASPADAQQVARAEILETRKDVKQVAQPTAFGRVTVQARTLDGLKPVNAKLYEMPGYDGPQLAVATYKLRGKEAYRVYLPKSGTLLQDSNGVSTLDDTLKQAVGRVRQARTNLAKQPAPQEPPKKPRSQMTSKELKAQEAGKVDYTSMQVNAGAAFDASRDPLGSALSEYGYSLKDGEIIAPSGKASGVTVTVSGGRAKIVGKVKGNKLWTGSVANIGNFLESYWYAKKPEAPKPKPTPNEKAKAEVRAKAAESKMGVPDFETYADAKAWADKRAKKYPSIRAFQASAEYKDYYPKAAALYAAQNNERKADKAASLEEAGLKAGDRVRASVVGAFLSQSTYTGTVTMRGGEPWVKVDGGMTVSSKGRVTNAKQVRWDSRWKKIEEIPALPPQTQAGRDDLEARAKAQEPQIAALSTEDARAGLEAIGETKPAALRDPKETLRKQHPDDVDTALKAVKRRAPTEEQKAEGIVATQGQTDAKGERKFYVTIVRDSKVARLAGPFDTKAEADGMVDRASNLARELDPRAAFDGFGVSAVTSENHKPGKLNEQLGLSAPPVEAAQPERIKNANNLAYGLGQDALRDDFAAGRIELDAYEKALATKQQESSEADAARREEADARRAETAKSAAGKATATKRHRAERLSTLGEGWKVVAGEFPAKHTFERRANGRVVTVGEGRWAQGSFEVTPAERNKIGKWQHFGDGVRYFNDFAGAVQYANDMADGAAPQPAKEAAKKPRSQMTSKELKAQEAGKVAGGKNYAKAYASLLNLKSTKILSDNGGRKLYEVQVSAAFSQKWSPGMGRRWPEADGLELKEKSEVTGRPQDAGYVLVDAREQKAERDRAANPAPPVEAAQQDVMESVEEDEPFFSAALRAVQEGKGAPKRGNAEVWKGWLDGAVRRGDMKQSERDWLGLDTWLNKQVKPVTREQLADFIRANEVTVQEVTLGDTPDEATIQRYIDNGFPGTTREEAIENARIEQGGRSGLTKFANYQLPGGENYRELLLTLPHDGKGTAESRRREIEREIAGMGLDGSPEAIARRAALREEANAISGSRDRNTYRSSHYDQPNILAHVRYNERVDSDGKKVLFIEEIQSDFGQSMRKSKLEVIRQVKSDFDGIVDRMKAAGVLEVECD